MTPRETTAARPDDDSRVRSSMNVPPDLVVGLLGSADENLRAMERSLAADLHVRGNNITLSGSSADVALAERVISELIAVVAGGQTLTPDAVRHSVGMVSGISVHLRGKGTWRDGTDHDVLRRESQGHAPGQVNQTGFAGCIGAIGLVGIGLSKRRCIGAE